MCSDPNILMHISVMNYWKVNDFPEYQLQLLVLRNVEMQCWGCEDSLHVCKNHCYYWQFNFSADLKATFSIIAPDGSCSSYLLVTTLSISFFLYWNLYPLNKFPIRYESDNYDNNNNAQYGKCRLLWQLSWIPTLSTQLRK